MVKIDAPIVLPQGKEKKWSPSELTDLLESRVQSMLDHLNQMPK